MRWQTWIVLSGLMSVSSSAQAMEPWMGAYDQLIVSTEAIGDFNGDGHMDKIAGYPSHEDGVGMVGIYFGNGGVWNLTNYGAPQSAAVNNFCNVGVGCARYGIQPAEPWIGMRGTSGWGFGTSVVVGDFDGDDLDDVAFGAPFAKAGDVNYAGKVLVVLGSQLSALENGLVPTVQHWSQATPGVSEVEEVGDHFGLSLTTGDFNCDGYDDLAIGVPGEDVAAVSNAGMVQVLYGSAGGLSTIGDDVIYQGYGASDTAEAYDQFGAVLTAGRFDRTNNGRRFCDSLAIGVPGEDIARGFETVSNAGAVHVLYPASSYTSGGGSVVYPDIGAGGEEMWHQDSPSIYSAPETNDAFGSSLGRRAQGDGLDALWVGSPNEVHSMCDLDGVVQTIPSRSSGLTGVGDSLTCQSPRPDMIETDRGWVRLVEDDIGRWFHYIPENFDPSTARVMVIVHGTNSDDYGAVEGDVFTAGFANATRYIRRSGWIDVAEDENLILISPMWEDWNFGNRNPVAGWDSTYRALIGRDILADDWLHQIVDRYAELGIGDGRFFLYGHSAGGQFTNRYLSQHPERLLGAVTESSGSYVRPDPGVAWYSGMGEYNEEGTDWGDLSYSPSISAFSTTAYTIPVYIVVGELDQIYDKDSGEMTGDRAQWALDWREGLEDAFPANTVDEVCLVPDVGHASSSVYQESIRKLFPSQGTPDCLEDFIPELDLEF